MPELIDYDAIASANLATPPHGLPFGTTGGLAYGVIREIMARCKRYVLDLSGNSVATGTGGDYIIQTARGITLTPQGVSVVWWSNHQNPTSGPTLNVGGTGARPLVYSDGGTIEAGGIKSRQIQHSVWDNVNGRWANTSPSPASFTGTVTGAQLNLQNQQAGSLARYTGSEWVAMSAGTSTQVLKGGATPAFGALPNDAAGMVLFAGQIGASNQYANRSGLKHSATYSRLSLGRYSLTVSPALPAGAMVMSSSSTIFRVAAANKDSSTSISVSYARHVDNEVNEDPAGDQLITVWAI